MVFTLPETVGGATPLSAESCAGDGIAAFLRNEAEQCGSTSLALGRHSRRE
jgi:hypothetical protein